MLVDSNGRFLTGRRFPILTQVRARIDGDALEVSSRGRQDLRVRRPDGAEREVQVWRDRLKVSDAGDEAASWLASRSQACAVLLPLSPGEEDTDTLASLYDRLVERLVAARRSCQEGKA